MTSIPKKDLEAAESSTKQAVATREETRGRVDNFLREFEDAIARIGPLKGVHSLTGSQEPRIYGARVFGEIDAVVPIDGKPHLIFAAPGGFWIMTRTEEGTKVQKASAKDLRLEDFDRAMTRVVEVLRNHAAHQTHRASEYRKVSDLAANLEEALAEKVG